MKKIKVSIFTEEYKVNLLLGKKEELIKELAKYTTYSPKTIKIDFVGRGICYNCLPDKHPIIAIDSDLPANLAIATIAHEASHAVNYIMDYLGIDDKSDEFHAHGISAIVRAITWSKNK